MDATPRKGQDILSLIFRERTVKTGESKEHFP